METKTKTNLPHTPIRRCNCPVILALSCSQKFAYQKFASEKDGYISLAKIYPEPGHHQESIHKVVSATKFPCPMEGAHQTLFPISHIQQDLCPSFSLAIVNNNVYCIGGASARPAFSSSADREHLFKASSEFSVHKTNPFDWIKLNSMSTPRYRPSVLTLDGKIYAFGCGVTPVGKLKCFAEVYDTSETNAEWKPFISTLAAYAGHSTEARVACSFIQDNTKVLIVFPFAYRVITVSLASGLSQSHTLGSSFAPDSITLSLTPYALPGSSNFVVVDDIVFFFPRDSSHLHAIRLKDGNFEPNRYDSQNSVFMVEGPGFSTRELGPVSDPSFLFHTGGMRFLLVNASYQHLFCFWFRVVNEGHNLRVVLDAQSCYLNHGSLLVDATMQCNCPVNLIEKKKVTKAQPPVIGTLTTLDALDGPDMDFGWTR